MAILLAGAFVFIASAEVTWGPLLGFCGFVATIYLGDRFVHLPARRYVERIDNYQCLHCGYSLTGNASGFCPECGSIVSPDERYPR